ncbi:MAG TPA: hypothetical protein VN622_12985 [Clostridia bacterium]|nr:hypothetical protein [Clostridia bacterium]
MAVKALSGTNRGRLTKGLAAGATAFAQSVAKTMHLLLLEVTGFIFLCFSVIGSFALVREYQAYTAGKVGYGRTLTALCFSAMFAYFGVSSFWRARRRH